MPLRSALPTAQRKDIQHMQFEDCGTCRESIVVATMHGTREVRIFEPKPVSGSGDEAVYQRHSCPSRKES